MRRPRKSWAREVFIEALMYALAEALVAALGWTLRRALKWWKKYRRKS